MKNLPIIISLLAFPCLLTAIALVGFVVSAPVQRWYAPLAFVLSMLIALAFANTSVKRRDTIVVFATTVLLAIFLSSLPVMFCVSDALNCYRVGVAMMTEGWNPLIETEVSDIVKYGHGFNPWHVAYAFKIPFIFGSALCKTFGCSSLGDSLNFISFVAAFLMVYEWLKTEKNLLSYISISVALFVLLSPNVVELSIGGKSDPALYHCIVIALIACDGYRTHSNKAYMITFLLATILASGVKATGLLSCCLICTVAWAADLFVALKNRQLCKNLVHWPVIIAIALILSVIFNPSPLMTSTIRHGTPFYPIRTSDGVEVPQSVTQLTNDCDVMNDDAQMLGATQRYIRAYISQDLIDKLMTWHKGEPFNPEWTELFTKPEGYGSFFRGCFVLAMFGAVFINDLSIWYMICAIFLTTIIVPTKFVGLAHYVQQIYILPLLVGVGLMLRFESANFKKCFLMAGAVYCAVLSFPKMCVIPYIWLSSVQSLQILDAVQHDSDPVIESRYYYGQFLWRHDSCIPVKVVTSPQDLQDYENRKSYGPAARRYSYLREGEMLDKYYKYNFKDVGREQALRRENAATFFVKEFLPAEWRHIALRMRQWCRLRSRQLHRAWAFL